MNYAYDALRTFCNLKRIIMEHKRLIDTPLRSKTEESLGLGNYADVLATFIRTCATPITIGIQGDWGIGKTSLLNMVIEQLRPMRGRTSRYHCIYFNTWQYSQFKQEELLGLSILKGIMEEIRTIDTFRNQDNETVKKAIAGFGKFVSSLGNQIVKKQTGLDVKEALQDNSNSSINSNIIEKDVIYYLRKMKSEFSLLVNSLIEKDGDKLIIFIDDLDRIKPVKALELLEAIKNFLDVEHCVFVMAVDYSVIQSGMAEKLGKSAQELQGKSYFDKIIQVPFNMPVSSYRTDRYIMSLLGWNYNAKQRKYIKQRRETFFLKIRDNELSPSDVDFFSNITALTVGKNPRGIKRAINYANLLKMIVEMKRQGTGQKWTLSDAKLLYPLACMQLAWPELFAHFSEHPSPSTIHSFENFDYLKELDGMDLLFKRVHDQEKIKNDITCFFDEFISLVDQDGNGEISQREFKPIWAMMCDANMTSAKLVDLDEEWRELQDKILRNSKNNNFVEVDKVLNLFKADDSNWNDPINFRIVEAGKKIYNLIWSGKQIGSLVTTQKEPIIMYLKVEAKSVLEIFSTPPEGIIIDVRNTGHYGSGDTKINLPDLAMRDDSVEIINTIHDVILKSTDI